MIGWKGKIRITAFDREGNVIDETVLENEIKDVGMNLLRDGLGGFVTDMEIKYMAWGSSATANATTQSALVAEFGRKAVTSQEAGGTGVLTTITYISPQEGTASTIEELGWFAGSGATATADSGVMVARVLYSRAKTALESIMVTREDQISEVV